MKKLLILVTVLTMLMSAVGIHAFAEGESVTVYVTIANGTLVMTQEAITVTDADNDGALTINDALYLAHEEKYIGGAAAGYSSAVGDYGLALTKLWGVENGGGYSYYINNSSVAGLTDTVKNGDYINAFIYTDTAAFSDIYCFFDTNTVSSAVGKEFTLTLSSAGYDASWNYIVAPVADAVIIIDGVETLYKTGADGKVTLKIDSAKTCVISAKSTVSVLVPPVCIATVNAVSPPTEDNGVIVYVLIAVIALSAVAFVLTHYKKSYEK